MDDINTSEQFTSDQQPNIKILEISTIENDFIYKMVELYLDQLSSEPSDDLIWSINNLVDTIMSFYLVAKQNSVIDIDNSRKLLELKLDNRKDKILSQCEQLNEDFEEFEKYLTEDSKKKENQSTTDCSEYSSAIDLGTSSAMSKINELLENHESFMSEMTKQSSDIKTLDEDSLAQSIKNKYHDNEILNIVRDRLNKLDTRSDTPFNTTSLNEPDNITTLEKRLKANIQLVGDTLKNKFDSKISDIISQSDQQNYKIDTISTTNIHLPRTKRNECPNGVALDQMTKHREHSKRVAPNPIEYIESNNTSTDISFDNQSDLDKAVKKLYTRLNTPLINLLIAFVTFKLTGNFLGF